MTILPEDFIHISALIKSAVERGADKDLRTLLSNNFNVIIAALDLAPTAISAIAYVDRNAKPLTKENVKLWYNLRDTVLAWEASQIEAAELADGVVKEIEVL